MTKKVKSFLEKNKIYILRGIVAASLIATAVVVGFISFYYLSQSQHELQQTHYNSVVRKVEQATMNSIDDKLSATDSLTNNLQFSFPNASAWPFVALPMAYYDLASSSLIDLSEARAMATAMIVRPSQVAAYESFAYQYFAANNHSDLGLSPFGRGIFSINYSNPLKPRFHDTQGNPYGQFRILLPVLMTGLLANNYKALMHNVYSDENRITVVDAILNCVLETTNSNYSHCVAVTDMIYLVSDYPVYRPANLVMRPVVVEGRAVAVTYTIYNWDTLLKRGISETVKGIHAIVRRGNQSYSFLYNGHNVEYLGETDQHDRRYESLVHSFSLVQFLSEDVYRVDLYPSQDWMKQYYNSNPIIFCVVTVSVVVFTSLVFFLYDYIVNRQILEKEIVLSTKRQFVRFISHEIRTPMNIVHLGLKVLQSEITQRQQNSSSKPSDANHSRSTISLFSEKDDQLQEWQTLISDIDESVDNAIAVLNDLINYDKLDLGKMTLDHEALNPWQLLRSAVKPFNVQARHANVDLSLDLEIDHATLSKAEKDELESLIIWGDRIKLSQVIRNLISNALKFTPSGGRVAIRGIWKQDGLPENVTAKRKKGAQSKTIDDDSVPFVIRKGSILWTITDTGAGLSKENIRNLFREGVQFHVNQLQAGQGSGLGLYISKGVVDLHEGSLTVESPGEQQGCTFLVEFPVYVNTTKDASNVEPNGEALLPIESKSSDLTEVELSFTSKQLANTEIKKKAHIRRILIVDDSVLNRKMLGRLLRALGYDFAEANDGNECLEYLKQMIENSQAVVHLILMDYEMPRLNGPDATRELRRLGFTSQLLPVIGITGNVLPEDTRLFLSAGADHVLHKPLTMPQLQEALQKYLPHLPTISRNGSSECTDIGEDS